MEICSICFQSFRLSASLSAHIAFKHNSSHQCSTCEQKFPNAKKLTEHRKAKHNGERNNINPKRRLEAPSSQIVCSFILRKIDQTWGNISFTCQECDKEFQRYEAICNHVKKVHLRVKTFECELCDASFMTSEWLKKHKEKNHGVKITSAIEKREKLLKEIQSYCSDSDLTCQKCHKEFDEIEKLHKHIKISHIKQQKVICDDCGKNFSHKASLKEHQFSQHGVIDKKKSERQRIWKTYGNLLPNKKQIECKVCHILLKGLFSTLKRHVSDVHERKLSYYCDKCGQKFHNQANFKTHMVKNHQINRNQVKITHSLELDVANKIFKSSQDKIFCTQCQKSYHKRYSKILHVKKFHLNMVHPCHYCGAIFQNGTELALHISNDHNDMGISNFLYQDQKISIKSPKKEETEIPDEWPFQKNQSEEKSEKNLVTGNIESHFSRINWQWHCKNCQGKFSKKDDMRRHYIIEHLGETPEICEICGDSFTAQGMIFHKELAHFTKRKFLKNMPDQKAFQLFQDGLLCKKCGREFKTEAKVQKHIQNAHLRQTKQNCEHCDAKFVSLRSKVQHLHRAHKIKHSKDQNQQKLLENLTFVENNLKRAKSFQKNGILHYECPICQRVTMRKAGLRTHLKLVHLCLKTLECPICQKKFASSGSLSYHIKFTHKKAKNPKEIVRQFTSRAVKIIKEGRNFYQCEICSKFLTGKQGLRLHLMNKHSTHLDKSDVEKANPVL